MQKAFDFRHINAVKNSRKFKNYFCKTYCKKAKGMV